MVLRVDVVDAALRAAYGERRPPARVIVLAPSGRQLDDALAAELAGEPHLALLCGRYEGVDERVREHLADDAVSIGPYVLAGGELAAMVVADTVLRKLPGALGHAESAVEESFSEALEGAPGVPALHAPGQLPRLGRARGAALGRPRAGARVAARAQPGRGSGRLADVERRVRLLSDARAGRSVPRSFRPSSGSHRQEPRPSSS